MSFLDIDSSELENKLLLNKNESDECINSFLENMVNKPTIPTKLVTPLPGLCIKTFTKTGEKVFINLCHTEEIPPPQGNRIPMSIGHKKSVTDKSGELCVAFDVALNSTFYKNNQNEIVLLTILEGISNKYDLDLNDNKYHVLKNVKCKGKIDPMNIEQRSVQPDQQKKPLISEINTEKKENLEKKPIVPDFNLIKVDSPREFYASEIDLKGITSKSYISLQIGEDRLYLSTNGNIRYELEYHFPEDVNNESCTTEFDSVAQILTIIVPLKK